MTREDHLVLYDGDCELCRGAVDFVRRRDRSGRWRFRPLKESSEPVDCETLHVFDADGRHERSDAVLRLAADLPPPWSWLRFLRVLPRGWRDAVYDFVARHRLSGSR